MAIAIKYTPVGGAQTTITGSIDEPSINLNLVLTKEVSSFEFDIMKVAGNTIPNVGDAIDIYEDQTAGNVHIYGGTITERTLNIDGGILARYHYTSVDGSFKFDSKMVVKTYTGMDAGDIVRDIISTFTTGFTAVNVGTAGFLLPSVSFNYQPPTKCLQKIASMIGWDWYIDANKDVHFFLSDFHPAPFNITDTNGMVNWGTLDFNISIQNLKNSVFVTGGNYSKTFSAATTSDVYTSVAGTFVYGLAYSYDPATIQVTYDGVAKTIGIDQKDAPGSFDLLYNAGQGNVGAFLRWSTDPGSGHVIKAFGGASIPILGYSFNPASIASYGEFQDNIVDKLITTVSEAQKRAQAEIAAYGSPSYTLNFDTVQTGLAVGQTITLTSTLLGVTQSFTIKRISGKTFTPTSLKYSIQAEATENVTFLDIMTLLLEQELNNNPIPSSTVLEVLIDILEGVALADTQVISTTSGPYNWGTAKWGFATYNT